MTTEERANDFVFNKKFYSKRTAYGNALARDLAVAFKEAQREGAKAAIRYLTNAVGVGEDPKASIEFYEENLESVCDEILE